MAAALAKVGRHSLGTAISLGRLSSSLKMDNWQKEARDSLDRSTDI